MAYNFKNLNEIPSQDSPTESTTVMAFEAGQPKQIPAGEFGGKGLVVDLRGYTMNENGETLTISDIVYDPIYEALMAGQNAVFQIHVDGADAFAPSVFSSIVPGDGFGVVLYIFDTCHMIFFTNGSYHTTT